MSSINPYNIDGTYPIAGQDNDSQGFRDNFTNIKNNFTFAKSELEDLQSKVILKSALAGVSFDNNMNYAQISSVELLRATETINDLGTIADTVTLSWDNGSFQYVDLNGNGIQLDLSTGWPTSGMYAAVKLQITAVTSDTLVLDSSVLAESAKKIRGVQYNGSSYVLTFPVAGTYTYEFSSYDGGVNVWMKDLSSAPRVNDYQYLTPTDGSIANVDPGASSVLFVPAGTIASANICMPGNTQVVDGQTISFGFGATITSVTHYGNGATILGGLTSGGVTTPAKYIFKTSTNTWYKIG